MAVANRIAIRDRLISLAEAAGVDNPQQLGAHLLLLIDGAFTQRRLFGVDGFDVRLKPIVAQLVHIDWDIEFCLEKVGNAHPTTDNW